MDQDEPPRLSTVLPTPLPDPLATIAVPEEFHPSSFVQLERCPLSVLGLLGRDPRGLLVLHPTTFFGLVLHHARQQVAEGHWGTARDAQQAAREILAGAVGDAEAALSSSQATEGLVPLRESVGRRTWNSRNREFERWADGVTSVGKNEPPVRFTLNPWFVSTASADSHQTTLGSEQTLSNRALRLRGRPDWSARVDKSLIEVVDFKSGRIMDADGRLLDEHVVQVQLYTLMLEATFPEAEVRPYLERVERVEVPWGDEERIRVMTRLKEASTRLPAGSRLEATELARPGEHCIRCRLRPMCPAYLSTAPSWWPDEHDSPRPLPLDVWGKVTSVVSQGDDLGVRLVDAGGRRVRIDGIDRRHRVAAVKRGEPAWFFDLQASEDRRQHGALVQPRNFHEHPPGPRWRPARRTRVFSGHSSVPS